LNVTTRVFGDFVVMFACSNAVVVVVVVMGCRRLQDGVAGVKTFACSGELRGQRVWQSVSAQRVVQRALTASPGVVEQMMRVDAKTLARDGDGNGEGGWVVRAAAKAKKGLRASMGGRLARSYWAESLKRSLSVALCKR